MPHYTVAATTANNMNHTASMTDSVLCLSGNGLTVIFFSDGSVLAVDADGQVQFFRVDNSTMFPAPLQPPPAPQQQQQQDYRIERSNGIDYIVID